MEGLILVAECEYYLKFRIRARKRYGCLHGPLRSCNSPAIVEFRDAEGEKLKLCWEHVARELQSRKWNQIDTPWLFQELEELDV